MYGVSLATGASHPLSNNKKTTPTYKHARRLSNPLPLGNGDEKPPLSPAGLHGNAIRPRSMSLGFRRGGWRRGGRFRGLLVILGVVTTVLVIYTTSNALPHVGLWPSDSTISIPSYPSFRSSSKKGGEGIAVPKGVHPIDILLQKGKERFDTMRVKQSRNIDEAVREYRRRYGRRPPKGFDKWWEYAQARKIVLVDEFDSINHDLAPFWGLSPSQIEDRRIELFQMAKSDRLLGITVRDGEIGDEDGPASSKKWPHNKSYYRLFEGYSKDLPDMNLLLNLNDQPVGFVSWEEKQRLIEAGRKGDFAPDSEQIRVDPVVLAKTFGLAFEDLRAACPPDSPARTYTTDILGETIYPLAESAQIDFRFPMEQGGFVHDVSKQMDICTNPALKEQHGNFIKPELNLQMQRNRLYPVFSWSKYKSSSDITIPTNYRFQWGPPDRSEWDKMYDKMAWRGTLTGMYPDNLAVFNAQRHRLMTMVQDGYKRVDTLIKNVTTREYELSSVRSGLVADRWLDVGIAARSWNRNNEVEKVVEKVIVPSERIENNERSLYKILLDVDGWGWSARYRELLRTSSAVIKTTVFHEAVSDWLIPWYHYIPINYDYSDLYSVLLYFFGLEESGQDAHDEALKDIAERSMYWSESQMGWEQHKVYVYRLCLEWARLTSEDRASMDYR